VREQAPDPQLVDERVIARGQEAQAFLNLWAVFTCLTPELGRFN
jgi:hypothetical protein